MVLGILRWRGRLDTIIRKSLRSQEKKIDARLLSLLRLGAYQILFLDRVPDSAAVNESVRLAKTVFKDEKISGFVNAVLRSIARNKNHDFFPSFEDKPIDHLTQALSHPRWLVERWVSEYGPELARKICEADNQRPPFTVRTNTLKVSRESLREQFEAAGILSFPTPFSPEGLILEKSSGLPEESLFPKGLYFVQDEASQMVAHLLGPLPGEKILDACAAPGGKSTHLAQLMEDRGEIIALDISPAKVKLIEENCQRMGITIVKPLRADVFQPLPFPPESAFDRVLLDAPCTGLGILHRNPEAKWRRKPKDILRLQCLQADLLDHISSRLKPGGVLLYSTCTMTREENDGVVEFFLDNHKDFELEDFRSVTPVSWHPLVDEKGFFRTYPRMILLFDHYRMDGFFAARMKKKVLRP